MKATSEGKAHPVRTRTTWLYLLLTGVFVYLVLPMDGIMRITVALAVTAGLWAVAYSVNSPRRRNR